MKKRKVLDKNLSTGTTLTETTCSGDTNTGTKSKTSKTKSPNVDKSNNPQTQTEAPQSSSDACWDTCQLTAQAVEATNICHYNTHDKYIHKPKQTTSLNASSPSSSSSRQLIPNSNQNHYHPLQHSHHQHFHQYHLHYLNPYHVLQIRRDATPSEIREAYRKHALYNHPGRTFRRRRPRNQQHSSNTQTAIQSFYTFSHLAACFETLLDNDTRSNFDTLLLQLQQQQQQQKQSNNPNILVAGKPWQPNNNYSNYDRYIPEQLSPVSWGYQSPVPTTSPTNNNNNNKNYNYYNNHKTDWQDQYCQIVDDATTVTEEQQTYESPLLLDALSQCWSHDNDQPLLEDTATTTTATMTTMMPSHSASPNHPRHLVQCNPLNQPDGEFILPPTHVTALSTTEPPSNQIISAITSCTACDKSDSHSLSHSCCIGAPKAPLLEDDQDNANQCSDRNHFHSDDGPNIPALMNASSSSSSSSSSTMSLGSAADAAKAHDPLHLMKQARNDRPFTDPYELFEQVFESQLYPRISLQDLIEQNAMETDNSTNSPKARNNAHNTTNALESAPKTTTETSTTHSLFWTGSTRRDPTDGSLISTTTRMLHGRRFVKTEIRRGSKRHITVSAFSMDEDDENHHHPSERNGIRQSNVWTTRPIPRRVPPIQQESKQQQQEELHGWRWFLYCCNHAAVSAVDDKDETYKNKQKNLDTIWKDSNCLQSRKAKAAPPTTEEAAAPIKKDVEYKDEATPALSSSLSSPTTKASTLLGSRFPILLKLDESETTSTSPSSTSSSSFPLTLTASTPSSLLEFWSR